MSTLGFNSLVDLAQPALVDAAYLRAVALADGQTFDEVVADIAAGLAELNRELLTGAHFGEMLSVTDEIEVEDMIDNAGGVEDATEYGVANPRRAPMTAHMLPIKPYDRAFGWTMAFLRKARQTHIDNDVRGGVRDMRDHWEKSLLTRLFKVEADKVGSIANASVPFVDAQATDTVYVPPAYKGKTFSGSHTHYLRIATLNQAALETAVATLAEHGHTAPFEIVGSMSDIATWTAVGTFTGYKAPEWAGIVYRNATDRAAIADTTDYFGYIETRYGVARLWLTDRVPTGWFGVYKTYGQGDARNPLRVRIDPTLGFGWRIVDGKWVNSPLELAVAYAEFGVGVGDDRTNFVGVKIAGAGNYTTPTIS